MNQTQKRYAIERVEAIENQKLRDLKESIPAPKPKKLTVKSACKLIKDGKVKMSGKAAPDTTIDGEYISKCFDFSKYHDYRPGYRCSSYDTEKYAKLSQPIIKKAQDIKDQLMLGNADEALKMIQEFEAK
jgi:hypothetical protein